MRAPENLSEPGEDAYPEQATDEEAETPRDPISSEEDDRTSVSDPTDDTDASHAALSSATESKDAVEEDTKSGWLLDIRPVDVGHASPATSKPAPSIEDRGTENADNKSTPAFDRPVEPMADGVNYRNMDDAPPVDFSMEEISRARPEASSPTTAVADSSREKLAIVGGKGTGKSYLFQAILHRLGGGADHGGTLSRFLNDGEAMVFKSISRSQWTLETIAEVTKLYKQWYRLEFTTKADQAWYRLEIPMRSGLLTRSRCKLNIDHFEASGEGFFEQATRKENLEDWKAFLNAKTVVFCLPLWAALPNKKRINPDDWEERMRLLTGLNKVLKEFSILHREHGSDPQIRAVLALTMADDRRCGYYTLRENWIEPARQNAGRRMMLRLRTGKGVIQYLSQSRKVSELIRKALIASKSSDVSKIPSRLSGFGHHRPWFIPVSAIDGDTLDNIENKVIQRDMNLDEPVPAHVELPVLLALSDYQNILM